MIDQFRKNWLLEHLSFRAEKFFAPTAADLSQLLDYGSFREYQGAFDEVLYEHPKDESLREISRRLWKVQWAMENELLGLPVHYHMPE